MPAFNISRICVMALLLALGPLPALSAANQAVAPGPVTGQISSAKKVFISNGSDGGCTSPSDYLLGRGPDRTYNQFYAAMKSWGRYQLVPSPADADLDFVVSFACPAAGRTVIKGDSSGVVHQFLMKLEIWDIRPHILLWTITEGMPGAVLVRNRNKNFDRTVAGLMKDLQRLVSVKHAPPAAGAGR